MTRIHKLSEQITHKIAAGEVVEGPFSVIKELIENAVDAEADEIDIEIIESGLKKITVKDNGIGIYRDDLPLAIENHATSKISDFGDIEKISSYGFRGEALSSISSISKLTILSRSVEEDTGARITSHNNKTEQMDYAGQHGTTVIVENLFYNVPARKKFLKSKSAELRKIREIFLKIAIANSGTGFTFSADGKRIITLPSTSGTESRITQIYGESTTENLYFDSLKDKALISGFLSRPNYLKASRSMQILYVNNRYLEYKHLGFLLSKAYEAVAPKGSYPAAIIFIEIEPELIDVNIHPAKKEIKFFDQNYINTLILRLCKKALSKVHDLNIELLEKNNTPLHIPGNKVLANNYPPEQLLFEHEHRKTETQTGGHYAGSRTYTEDNSFRSFITDAQRLYGKTNSQYNFKYLGIIFDTYIIIEKDETLSFIDFHAAHERYIYDTINKNPALETQNLIFPQVIELSVEDYQIFLEKKEYFINTAFDIEIFSDKSIIIRGIPAVVKDLNIEGFFSDILESFKDEGDHIQDINRITAEKLACHSAKRSGDSLSTEDAMLIVERALSGDHELRCPHGRPYIFKLEKKDLEKAFKRT